MLNKLLTWLVLAILINMLSFIFVSCNRMTSTRQPVTPSPATNLPSIQVKAFYPGADIQTILDSIAPPLNDSIFHHVSNMDHMTYTASIEGSLIITVYLKPGTDPDLSALNISNLVSIATKQLPSQVAQSGITVLKKNESIVMAVNIYPEDPEHSNNQASLNDYAAINIIPEIQQVPGVSHLVIIDNSKDSLLRIWLNKAHMTSLNLTLKEVLAAIPAEKQEAVTGILYRNGKQNFDYTIKCKSRYNELVKYSNMIIRTDADTVLKLKDVAAKIEFSPYTYGNFTRINRKPGISIVVMQPADSNHNGIPMAIKSLLETASTKFPAGVKHSILYNPEDSLYISVD